MGESLGVVVEVAAPFRSAAGANVLLARMPDIIVPSFLFVLTFVFFKGVVVVVESRTKKVGVKWAYAYVKGRN